MKKRIAAALGALFLTFGPAGNAHSVQLTLDFSSGSYSNQSISSFDGSGDTYSEDGFTLTTGPLQHFDAGTSAGYAYSHSGPLNDPYDWTATLAFGGAAFDFLSFDYAGSGGLIVQSGLNSSTFGFAGWQTASVALLNVTAVTFLLDYDNGADYLQLDNFVVETNPSSAVPEPSTMLLLGSGLLGLVGLNRRRRV